MTSLAEAPAFSERELNRIREEQQDLTMPDRADFQRRMPITPHDEQTSVYATDVHVRITAGFGTFRDVADRFQGVTAYTLTAPFDLSVRAGDEAIHIFNGEPRVFKVLAVREGPFHTALPILAELIT